MTELPRKNISLLIPLLGISVSFVLLWLADMRSHRESLVWGEMGWGAASVSLAKTRPLPGSGIRGVRLVH